MKDSQEVSILSIWNGIRFSIKERQKIKSRKLKQLKDSQGASITVSEVWYEFKSSRQARTSPVCLMASSRMIMLFSKGKRKKKQKDISRLPVVPTPSLWSSMPRNKHFDPWIFSKKISLKQLSQTLLNPKTKENQCLYNLAICIWLPTGLRSNFNYRNIRKWKQCLSSKTQAMSARSSIIHKTRLRCCCLYITVLQWYLNSQNFLRLANCSMLTFLFLFKVKKRREEELSQPFTV